MSPTATDWTLLTRCPSVGHAELLLAALGKAGLGGEIRGRHLPAVQARNVTRANEVLRELERRQDEATVRYRACSEESPENFETCWACGAVLPVAGR
jgi:hypothetical protein